MFLSDFVIQVPTYCLPQEEILNILSTLHQNQELIDKFCCKPDKISQRYTVVDLSKIDLYDKGFKERGELFAAHADQIFDKFYTQIDSPPDDLIHVTCTGYNSPSAGQKLVAKKGWKTTITHAYHMGCMAAIPAIRMASGFVSMEKKRVDIVHTELCSLHLKRGEMKADQLIAQSLFADGLIKYTLSKNQPGLEILAIHEEIIPDTDALMKWECQDWGLKITLAKEIPVYISRSIETFILELEKRCRQNLSKAIYAIHPGGPKIVEQIAKKLNLSENQLEKTKEILCHRGNMSSATLPHIWEAILKDRSYPAGSLIVGLAFGPGLCICGVVLKK